MATISILGKATSGEADSYWLALDIDSQKWLGGEPGNTSKVITTKSGTFVYKALPDKGTYCLSSEDEVVIFLRKFNPSTAKAGDTGSGNANETGRTISWKVDSI